MDASWFKLSETWWILLFPIRTRNFFDALHRSKFKRIINKKYHWKMQHSYEFFCRCGFISRDIKPGNFAVGLREEMQHRTIFLFDFGLAKKHSDRVRFKLFEYIQCPPLINLSDFDWKLINTLVRLCAVRCRSSTQRSSTTTRPTVLYFKVSNFVQIQPVPSTFFCFVLIATHSLPDIQL